MASYDLVVCSGTMEVRKGSSIDGQIHGSARRAVIGPPDTRIIRLNLLLGFHTEPFQFVDDRIDGLPYRSTNSRAQRAPRLKAGANHSHEPNIFRTDAQHLGC